ncbi:MAG: c-type cytochrome biogenesis protein CcsB [bacterium]
MQGLERTALFGFLFLSAGSAFFYLLYCLLKKEMLGKIGLALLSLGFLSGAVSMVTRAIQAGRPLLTNLYEVLVFTSLGIAFCFIIVQIRRRISLLGVFVAPVIFFLLLFALTRPVEIRPLLPALKSPWLLWHVGLAILSYGAFAVAFGVALLYLWREAAERKGSPLLKNLPTLEFLDSLGYRCISLGLPLLTLVIVSGAVWAQQAFGQYWQWDPKETWSLITFLVYAGYLHARLSMRFKPRLLAIFSVLGFLAVLFCFLGVNLLMSGHHSEITR